MHLNSYFLTVFDLACKKLVNFFKKPIFNSQNKIFCNEVQNKTFVYD